MGEYEYATVIAGYAVTVNKTGGGTLGRSYAGNWEVTVLNGDVLVIDNEILQTGSLKSHKEIAKEAVMFAWGREDSL